MAEVLDETLSLESTTVGVYRTAATVKGGRRFSFSSLVVVGDKNGSVGIGYGKANQVPNAIEKAQKEAKRKMRQFPMTGRTIPHEVTGTYGACRVRLIPASPGTGIIAGSAVRAPLEMMGLQDCLTKSYGSSNGKNLVKAVLNGLENLRSKAKVQLLRGVELEATAVEESIERSTAFVSKSAAPAPPKPLEIPPAEADAAPAREKTPPKKKDAGKPDDEKAPEAAEAAETPTADAPAEDSTSEQAPAPAPEAEAETETKD